MQQKNTRLALPALVLSAFAAVHAAAAVQSPDRRQARVTPAAARAAALKAFAGQIVSAELERERGGSGLRYSFDIRRGAVTHEVGIDAKTGALLQNSSEGPDAD
jgi:uncharacterized membrane protein YkoI